MSEKKDSLNVDDILSMANDRARKFIAELEKQSANERIESVTEIENDIKAQKIRTERDKLKFIKDVKSGLGNKIKDNPNAIRIIKKPWYVKLGAFFKNIFTKF